jgi:hypothetical protein
MTVQKKKKKDTKEKTDSTINKIKNNEKQIKMQNPQ